MNTYIFDHIKDCSKAIKLYDGLFFALVLENNFKDIWKRFKTLYPDQKKSKKGYEITYKELCDIVIEIINNDEKLEVSDKTITIHHVATDPSEEMMRKYYRKKKKKYVSNFTPYYSLVGKAKTDEYPWALELTDRKEWLMMPYDKNLYLFSNIIKEKDEIIGEISDIDILCHSLWYMTFFGFTNKEVEKQDKILMDRKKECDKAFESGDMSKFIEFTPKTFKKWIKDIEKKAKKK